MPTEEKYAPSGSSELNERQKYPNTADKFRVYRLYAESNEKKLKEAEMVIQVLKNEINFTKDAEKNLRSQISLAQNRIIFLQQTLTKFLSVSDQQRRNEKVTQQIEEKIQGLREEINKTRHESQNVFKYASGEVHLLKKIKELESALNVKERDFNLMKMEIVTLAEEKTNMENEFQQKLKDLTDDLEKSAKKEAESVIHFNETLKFYKHQIDDYEQKIKQYEIERKSFLEDFELPRNSESNSKNFTLMDSIVATNADDRSPSFKKPRETITDLKEVDASIFHCSSHPRKPKLVNSKKEKAQNLPRTRQVRPRLEFLTQTVPTHPSKDLSLTLNSAEYGRKRRLFSKNCNHYID